MPCTVGRRRPAPSRARGVVACAPLLVAVLAGCTGAVEVEDPGLDEATEAECREFLDALPAQVADQEARETDPEEAPARAWGDPAITVTCGVDAPEGFDRFSPCEEVDGVGWYVTPEQVEDPTADVELTTIGVRPRVRVTVPGELRPPAGILVEVGAAVRTTLGVDEPCV